MVLAPSESSRLSVANAQLTQPSCCVCFHFDFPLSFEKQAANESTMGDRFEHLLQPIRDLAQNWDIDVASELEQYLEEVRNFVWRIVEAMGRGS